MADDDPDDQYLVRRAMEDLRVDHVLHTVNNGTQLIDFLHARGEYRDLGVARPDFILLDLNMPLLDGLSTLRLVKSDHLTASIPVYVLSTSRQDTDRNRSIELGAAGFFVKPTQFPQLRGILTEIWQSVRDVSAAEKPN